MGWRELVEVVVYFDRVEKAGGGNDKQSDRQHTLLNNDTE